MKKDSLTYHTFKNGSYSIFNYIWSIIFSIIITPIIVFKLGIKEYGIYLFIITAMSLFGVIDIGIGSAVTKYMSFYVGKKDNDSIIRLTHLGNLIFLITGLIGFFISMVVTFIGTSFLPASFVAYESYSSLFVFAGGIFFFSVVISSYNSVFYALQRFDISSKIGIFFVTFSSLSMLFVVEMGWSIRGVFISQLIVSILYAVVIYYKAKKLLPIATFKFKWHRKEFFECYKFGFVSSINNIASIALASFDKIIIPFFVGPSNLTYYSIPGNVATKIPGITSTLSISLLPTIAQLSGSDEIYKMKIFYIRMFRIIIIIAGSLTVTVVSFSYEILKYWLNSDFAEKSSNVLIILALTNFILALFSPLSNFLLGLDKLKFLSLASIGMATLNMASLFLLLPLYGIIGAALAYLISVLPVFYIFYYVETRYLELPNRKNHYIKTILGTIITSFSVLMLNIFISQFVFNLVTLLIAGGISVVMYVIVYKIFGFFEDEDWRDIRHFFLLILKKLN